MYPHWGDRITLGILEALVGGYMKSIIRGLRNQ